MDKLKGVLADDIREILSDTNIPWEDLRGVNVLITGATGLVGGALARSLAAAHKEHGLNLSITALGRNEDKLKALAGGLGIKYISHDMRKPLPVGALPKKLDYIFHCAAMTKSADMVSSPADVMLTEVRGLTNALEAARPRLCKSFVYTSSMEVYGMIESGEVREKDLGYLDLCNPRSSYPEGKRFGEALCTAYFTQYGVPVKTARLAQTFGAGTEYNDTRVFAQFARSAFEGRDIELHTEGKTWRCYCYLSDAIRALLTVLLKGVDGETYNIANPDAGATIMEMAEMVAEKVSGGKIKAVIAVPDDIDRRGYMPTIGFKPNVDKLTSLGWTPAHSLEDMYRRMLAHWRETLKGE